MATDVLKFSLNETGYGKVELNGVELEGVTHLRVEAKPGELTKVDLSLVAKIEGGLETAKE